jgi:hypothetical protein
MAARPKGRRPPFRPPTGVWPPVQFGHAVNPTAADAPEQFESRCSSTWPRCSTRWSRPWPTGSASSGATAGSPTPSWPSAPGAWPPTCTARGLGVHTAARATLAGHESGQDHVALALYNGNEYLEGCWAPSGPGGPVQRELPLRRRGAALPPQRRPAARPHLHSSLAPTLAEVLPTLDAPPDVLLQVADESGHRPAPRGGRLRGGPGRVLARRAAGRPLPRRPLHPLHGRHHGHAQGRAVAPARHLHGAMGPDQVGTWESSPATRGSPSG